jgi:peroxiredoxin
MKRFTLLFSFIALFFKAFAQDSGLAVGDAAVDFKLKNIDGKNISLATYKKEKGLIVIFTCNHCPYSVAYEDRIIALHNTFAKQGFPVIAINPNDPQEVPEDSFDAMKVRAKEKKFPFRYVFDETQAIAKSYGATRTPHVFLLRNNGKSFDVAYIGAIDNSAKDESAITEKYVEAAISALQKGEIPATSSTKAIGCGIKWKKANP